ncbi:MAG TPA: MFS transporter [Phnomibacter sp.]|nr:MFS transporter [Phnomibacter sp.]
MPLTDRKILPALSEHSILRYFTFIVLYFSQGIPEGITFFAIPAWMAMNGRSAAEIATYGAIIMIPFSFKIVLAPFMERFTFLPMGRRRPWLLFGQFGILCGLVGLSIVPDPLNNLSLLTVTVVCVHVFIMFQDIATDSLVIDIVPLAQQGKANSLMWGAKVVGSSASLAICSWLMGHYGFSNAIFWISGSILLIMFVPLFLRERMGEKLLPWSAGTTSPEAAGLVLDSFGKLFRSFWQVILLRNLWLFIVITFFAMAAVHYMRTLLPIFTIQGLGWNNVFYSNIYSTTYLVGGILGMLTGGFIISRLGVVRMLQGVLFAAGIMVVFAAFANALWKSSSAIALFIGCINLLTVFIYISVLALAMQLCWKRISAMQFTFCMTVFNAALATGAALLGDLRNYFGWQGIFLIFSATVFTAMLLLRYISVGRHLEQVEQLEKNYMAKEVKGWVAVS